MLRHPTEYTISFANSFHLSHLACNVNVSNIGYYVLPYFLYFLPCETMWGACSVSKCGYVQVSSRLRICAAEVDGFTTFAIHDSRGFTRWLWWFNSTRFIFSGCSKETRFPIPNYISIEVNDSTHDSFRAMANWSRFNSIQFIHELQCKMLQIHLLHICHNSSQPKLSKSVAKKSVIGCCWHFWDLH